MYRLLLLLFSVCCVVSCSEQETSLLQPTDVPLVVGHLEDDQMTLDVTISQVEDLFTKRFSATELTDLEITQDPINAKFYLFAEGPKAPNADGEVLISAMRFELNRVGNQLSLMHESELKTASNGGLAYGEECNSSYCGKCAFKEGGGCKDCPLNDCRKTDECFCNHRITRGSIDVGDLGQDGGGN